MNEEVKKILEEFGEEVRQVVETPDITLIMVVARVTKARDKAAQQICQLFPKSPDNPDGYEPKPDEGKLLTDMGRTQEVGNKNEDDFTLSCVLCGDTKELTLTAHRSMSGKVCGWLVACIKCQPNLCNFNLVDAKTASIKDAEIKSWMKAFGEFRSELRNILGRHGIFSNLGWGDDEVLRAVSSLLESKDAECQERVEGIFKEIEGLSLWFGFKDNPKWQSLKKKEG